MLPTFESKDWTSFVFLLSLFSFFFLVYFSLLFIFYFLHFKNIFIFKKSNKIWCSQ